MAAIVLRDLSVSIPVFDVARASLRKALLGRAIGGRFAETGSHVVVNALKNIDLDMHDGDRVALVGDNGSGKSTLLRSHFPRLPPIGGDRDNHRQSVADVRDDVGHEHGCNRPREYSNRRDDLGHDARTDQGQH